MERSAFSRPDRLAAVLGPPHPHRSRSAPGRMVTGGSTDPATVPLPLDEVLAADVSRPPGRTAMAAGSPWRRGTGRTGARSSAAGSGWTDPSGIGPGAVRTGRTGSGRIRSALGRLWPTAWRRARIDPGRPGATALVLVAVAAAVLAAWGVWAQRPQAQPVGALSDVSVLTEPPATRGSEPAAGPGTAPTGPMAGPAAGAAAVGRPTTGTAAVPSPPAAPVVVNVSGKVRRPGLVELPSGARVADAVAAAGGALPGTDLATLNLARRITDGEQVAVGVPAAPDAAAPAVGGAGAGSAGTAAAPAGRVDLNMATADQLDGLPGVGPVTAQRIVEWRMRNGRFAQVEQLREIEGIGERRFAQLRDLVTL